MKKIFKIPRAGDQVTIAYQAIVFLLIIFNYSKIQFALGWLLFHLMVSMFLFWDHSEIKPRIIHFVKTWNPVFIIPVNFTELHYLVHQVNPVDFDQALINLDFALFGVHPTVWMENIQMPWLTEYLQLIYTTFYFLPIILGYILIRSGREKEFDFYMFALVLGFYLSYIGYFMVPAIGPRFTLDHLQTIPIKGIYLTVPIQEILNKLENIQRDAFPSGHTEMTVLTMYYSYKYSKKYFYVLLIVGTSMIFSTVYLRYHYVVDVIAGLALAVVVIMLAPRLYEIVNDFKKMTNLSKNQENSGERT